jgi:hypothetical protein
VSEITNYVLRSASTSRHLTRKELKKMNSEDKKKEIVNRWKDLLCKQPNALINSGRSPTPMSPYICFCLSEQYLVRQKLYMEHPKATVSVLFCTCPLQYESFFDLDFR